MIDEKQSAEPLANNKTFEGFIVYSDLLLAARFGWRWIVGLILLAIGVSVVWDIRRPPLYEAKATIRVGWVYIGSNILPLEPVGDLIITAKEGRFLIPFFADMGFVSEYEKVEFEKNLSLRVKAPQTNVVEFKIISRSPENARAWLDRLISMKIAEHEKIINGFVAQHQQRVAECFRGSGSKNSDGHAALLYRCLPQDLIFGNPVPPLMAKTIVSQPVNIEEVPVFPSLRFLIVASILGGLIFGTFVSFIFVSHEKSPKI